MGNNNYKYFFAALKTAKSMGCNLSKEELVEEFTEGRTSSLKELSAVELREIVLQLNRRTSPQQHPPSPLQRRGEDKGGAKTIPAKYNTPEEIEKNNMRKAIIAQFRFIGKKAIDAIEWAEKQGVKGQKKRFNDYTKQELFVLIQVAIKVKEDHLEAIRKQK